MSKPRMPNISDELRAHQTDFVLSVFDEFGKFGDLLCESGVDDVDAFHALVDTAAKAFGMMLLEVADYDAPFNNAATNEARFKSLVRLTAKGAAEGAWNFRVVSFPTEGSA